MSPSAISVSHVSKRFRRHAERTEQTTLKSWLLRDLWRRRGEDSLFTALDDVSFEVPAGSTFGVIGRNGSGKSTLMKLLTRIYKPDGGEVQTRGRVAALIELGAGFHPELSGRENILINAIILGLTKAEVRERTESIIAFSELEEFIDDPVRTYSSGMYSRLGFAVAVHVDPEILLIDEVLSVGDAGFTRKCIERMDAFKASGKTIAIVTHDVGFVSKWCDRAVWLDHGKVRALGLASEVAKKYLAHFDEEGGTPEEEAEAAMAAALAAAG